MSLDAGRVAPQSDHGTVASDLVGRSALVLLLVVCAGLVTAFLAVSLLRMSYRFELEPLEGLTVDYAWRIRNGLTIYAPPNATFAPNMYPPLYYFASLPVLILTGWSLFGPRLLSWGSIVGSGALTVGVLRRSGVSPTACTVALGVAAAFYPVTFHWYDLARVDSLQTLLIIAGLALLATDGARPNLARIWAGAFVLVCAVFTKQTSVFVCVATLAYFAATRDWRRCVHVAAALGLFGCLAVATLLLWSPQALTYTIRMPAQHRMSLDFGHAQMEAFAWRAAPLMIIVLYPLITRQSHGRPVGFFTSTLLGALVAAFLTLVKVGGQTNSAIPAIFLLGIGVGLGADELWRAFGGTSAWRLFRACTAVSAAAFLVLTSGVDYRSAVPGAHDRQVAEELWRDMTREPGPFLAYNHSFVSTVLRGDMYPSADRLYDYAGGYSAETFRRPDVSRYPDAFLAAIREKRFVAIYAGGVYPYDPVNGLIATYYHPAKAYGATAFGVLPEDAPRWAYCLPRFKFLPNP